MRCVDCSDDGSSSGNGSNGSGNGTSASSVDLCPDCFAGKVEIGSHEAHHHYQLIDDGGFVLFPTSSNGSGGGQAATAGPDAAAANSPQLATKSCWTAREHLVLLDAVERHGFGNWYEILTIGRLHKVSNTQNIVRTTIFFSISGMILPRT